MGEYRLTQSAKDDLIAIAQYGDEHFGVAQSNRYRDRLKQRFSVLAEQPHLYPSVDHIRLGYHRRVCGVHSIYYRIDAKGVEIMRVLKHQDPGKAL
ncbi:MAG: type II toxin-antitoxin system RelE/ParE family toxin [Woeseiaceae bacterium]|nr:type II toxin-antitoxin system RelE/ParE family toxin [Woeseiaceae bacterium]